MRAVVGLTPFLDLLVLLSLLPAAPSQAAQQAEAPATAPASQPAPGGDLISEESLARLRQVLQRRPLHATAFNDLVRHYTEQGKLPELVKEFEQQAQALPDDVASQVVLARLYLRAGQVDAAVELTSRIEQRGAKVAEESKWLVFKAEVYQRAGRLEDAQGVLNEALAQAKTVSERLRLSEGLADLYLRANDRAQAAAVLVKLGAEFPDNYLHRKHIADDLAQRDLHAEAAEQYRQILPLVEQQTDERCEVLRQLGLSLERLDRREEAIAAYTQAVNLLASGHWLQRELHDRIVSLYRSAGRLDELVQYCRAQVERAPEQTALRALLADVLATTDDVPGAKATFAEAVQLFPKDKLLSQRRIELLERLADPEGVAAEYDRSIAEFPDDLELYIAYGQFLAGNRQLEAARNQWKHVLQSALADATLAHRLGTLFEPYELLDDAVECYERAITLSPERPESYAALSRLWFFRGEKDKALEVLQRMAAAKPDDAATQAAVCQAALALGLTDEALAGISRACELAPEHVDYQTTRADLLLQTGKLEESLAVRRATLDRMQNAPQQADSIGVLVSMYATANRLAALKAAETEHLRSAPDDPVSLMLLARAADVERDFPAARRWLQTLLAANPLHEEAGRQLARLTEALGDIDGAVDMYRRLIDQHPARARQYYQAIADVRLRYVDKAGAIDTFEKMVQAAPGNATVLKDVAEQVVRLGEFDKGLALYEQSLRLQPDRHEVRLSYAKALAEAGRLDEALAAYRTTALQRADRDSASEALSRLYETAGQLGQLETLIDELQARVESDPEDRLVVRALAELLIRELEYSRALDLLNRVLRQQPRDTELQLVRAEVLRRLARFDDAIDGYRLVLRYPDADRDFVLGELGKAYFEAGRIDQAKAAWRQIGHKLYAGTLLKNNGLLSDAIDVLREGIRVKPDDYGLHRNLIRALEAAGRVDDALEAATRLLDLEPDNVLNIKEVARAYLQRGNRAAAADVASRLFSAAVTEKQPMALRSASGGQSMPVWMQSVQAAWGGFGNQPARTNLDAAIEFFQENGLHGELEQVITAQLEAQPDNAMLRQTAAGLFAEQFGKPDVALQLLKDLETATFPLEYQQWLGQCSQRDFVRARQYQLIATKPALRDRRLGELEGKPGAELTRDERLELAVIRNALGATDRASALLKQVLADDPSDLVALSGLVDILARAERFTDAEPFARDLCDRLTAQREHMQAEMNERVRRDFVRTLPLQFQMRVNDDLLRDIAHKWTLGQSFYVDLTGGVQMMGYFRARLVLATICAKTERMAEARAIWAALAPTNPADADGWTMLAGVVQQQNQDDLAFEYYQHALGAARLLAADPLLQRIYSGSASQTWFGEGERIDSSFNKIVEAFARHEQLIELYDFLRESEQSVKARRVAEQYDLYDRLKALCRTRVDEAQARFRADSGDAFGRSLPYFLQTCKLAELYDWTGDWPAAQRVYEDYLADFPDELGLLITLGEAAEAQGEYQQAVEWEQKTVAAKERLQRRARDWALRDLYMTPARPQVLGENEDRENWMERWGKGFWWWGGSANRPLEIWPSWLRIARLYLSLDNVVAAGRALERASGAAGSDREKVAKEILSLIRQRQLTTQMLPVLRALAVQMPTDENVQLAFAEALAANDKPALAGEVYQRMLRRGVSDLGVLAQVRQQLDALSPDGTAAGSTTLEAIEAEVAGDPENANHRLRLARAYYYSLDMDKALEQLRTLEATAPHIEGLHDLLIEIYTIRGDADALVDALRTKIQRMSDEKVKRAARRRLADELLSLGRTDEALSVLKELPDPKDPRSYERAGMLLHYFGRHDEAIEEFQLADRSQAHGGWGDSQRGLALARAMAVKGDWPATAAKIIASVDAQAMEANQMGGIYGAYNVFNSSQNYFRAFAPLFVVEPSLVAEVQPRLERRYKADPEDPAEIRMLMQFYSVIGRPDQAEALLARLVDKETTDQTLVMQLISRAVQRKEYDKAAKLAEDFIAQQPKPTLPPGVPPQFAGMMLVIAPRNMALCALGDVYWKKGDADQAFATYRQIVDEQVDETRVAYASICMLRGRVDEARTLIEETLAKQAVKSPTMLQFQALLAALADQPAAALDSLAQALESGADQANNPYSFGDGGQSVELLAEFAKRTQQIDRFAEFVRKRIQKNPNDWNNYRLLAQTFYGVGRVDDAARVLAEAADVKSLRRQALQERVGWVEGYTPDAELIPLYQELVDLTERQVKKQEPDRWAYSMPYGSPPDEGGDQIAQGLRDRLGGLLWGQGEHGRAEETWVARRDRRNAGTHDDLGRCFLVREEYERAGQCFQQALKLQPADMIAHRAMAELAFHAGDDAAAIDHLREVFLDTWQKRVVQPKEDDNSPYRYTPWNRPRQAQEDQDSLLRQLAQELARRGARDAVGSDEAADVRMMFATLLGDWTALESELHDRLETSRYDPVVWTLWAQVLEHKGAWREAAQACEYIRRLKQTTIGEHREQLKLVLAGKQVKEAAAGIKEAQPQAPTPTSPQPRYYYGSYYDDWYRTADAATRHLAGLYIRLGEYEQAERLYLICGDQGITGALPTLASMMWRQGAKERARELMRLALLLGGNTNLLNQYAGMLADAGAAADGISLLERAYCSSSPGDEGPQMYFGYYGGDDRGSQFETNEEMQYAAALYALLLREGKLDDELAQLENRARAQPDDVRLVKLVLSLQARARRWEAARDSLAAWRRAQPHNPGVPLEQFHTFLQLADWDAALNVLAELRKDRPELDNRWRMCAAFVRLMQGNGSAAAEALEPILNSPATEAEGIAPPNLIVALASAHADERLTQYLEQLRDTSQLDELGRSMLLALLQAHDQYAAAARTAFDQLWHEPGVLASNGLAYRALCAMATQNGKMPAPLDAAENQALWTMIIEGPGAGVAAFQQLVAAEPDNLNARRGLIFAAGQAGDWRLATQANEQLLAWLGPRRREVWWTPPQRPLAQTAAAFLTQMKATGLNTQSVLGMTMAFTNLFQQAMQFGARGGPGEAQPLTFDVLWRAHQGWQCDLLCRSGDTEQLTKLIQSQAFLGEALTHSRDRRNDNTRYYYGPYGTRYSYSMPGGQQRDEFERDWRAALRRRFVQYHAYEPLIAACEALGSRVPQSEWLDLSAAYAATGRTAEAQTWLQKAVDLQLVALQATDLPRQDSDDDRYTYYWWGWYGGDTEQVNRMRAALSVELDPTGADDERETVFRGRTDELWELARLDPATAARLEQLGAAVGPGWLNTATVFQLVAYHRAAGNADKIIALLEQAGDFESLLRSARLPDYLRACYQVRDQARVEKVLAAARELSSTLANDVDVARLMLLRHGARDAEADALEKDLVGRCRFEPPNPQLVDPRLADVPDAPGGAPRFSQNPAYSYGRRYSRSSSELTPLPESVAALAGALGVRYEEKVTLDDVTLQKLSAAYLRHQLYRDAARILDLELAQAQGSSPRRQAELLQRKAECLARAGDREAARGVAAQVEELWRQQAAEVPTSATPYRRLAAFFASKRLGPDYARALEALRAAKKLDPGCDDSGLQEAGYLFELGRFAEAWPLYLAAISRGDRVEDVGILYRAGIAAAKTAQADAARPLLREARWRDPEHKLAAQAAEWVP
jgi:tetratricopeptide (TPR) repeat protein